MSSPIDETFLQDALAHIAVDADEVGWRMTREIHLQRASESLTASRSARLKLDTWPGVGRLDLVLPEGVALELKWAIDDDTLCNCAWDVAKLASGLAAGKLKKGYLLAGAPDSLWASQRRGTELLDDQDFTDDAIVDGYEDWWRFWCKAVKTQPTQLPRAIGTVAEHQASALLDGEPFTLRLTRVIVLDNAWVPFVCPHVARDEACGPRRAGVSLAPRDNSVKAPAHRGT